MCIVVRMISNYLLMYLPRTTYVTWVQSGAGVCVRVCSEEGDAFSRTLCYFIISIIVVSVGDRRHLAFPTARACGVCIVVRMIPIST